MGIYKKKVSTLVKRVKVYTATPSTNTCTRQSDDPGATCTGYHHQGPCTGMYPTAENRR